MIVVNFVVYSDTCKNCIAAANLETGLVVFDREIEGLKFEAMYAHRKGIKPKDGWPLETEEMEKWMTILGRCESMGLQSDRDGNLYEFWRLK